MVSVRRLGYLLAYAASFALAAAFLVSALNDNDVDVRAERARALEAIDIELSASIAAAEGYVALLQRTLQDELAARPPSSGSILTLGSLS